jgi:hypothetical protein
VTVPCPYGRVDCPDCAAEDAEMERNNRSREFMKRVALRLADHPELHPFDVLQGEAADMTPSASPVRATTDQGGDDGGDE